MSDEKWRMTIAEVLDGRVVCQGVFPGHRGMPHSSLRPVVHMGECQWAADPKVGDTVVAFTDGTFKHIPGA